VDDVFRRAGADLVGVAFTNVSRSSAVAAE
jgi:hypothetical protein